MIEKCKGFFLSLLFLMCFNLFSQNIKIPKGDFIAPVIGKMEINGTYCELRPNHFHGGIDIRTDAQIGRQIVAIGDGYISRINISSTGYGKALYINHPNGFTSVYAHLSDFPQQIKWYIQKNQYQQKKYEIELYPEKDLFTIKQGQLIAYSGNTGGSQGPHLHFEIRETSTESPINPLLFGLKMNDVIAPSIQTIWLYSKDSVIKQFTGHYPNKIFQTTASKVVKKGKKNVTKTISLPYSYVSYGKYALGVLSKDFATSMGDNNGTNYLQLFRNNELIYDCKIEKFSFDHNRMFNIYIDYEKYKNSNQKIHKLFIDDGNKFRFYEDSPTDGWFEINDTLIHEFKIVVKDVFNNTNFKIIKIKGKPNEDYSKKTESKLFVTNYKMCFQNKENVLEIKDQLKIILLENCLFHPMKIGFFKFSNQQIKVGEPTIPINKKVKIMLKLNEYQLTIADKLVFCYSNGKSFGGVVENGWLVAEAKELGNYTLLYDNVPPFATALTINKNGYFSFKVSDNLSGIKKYDFFINDEWVLLEYEPKSSLIFGHIPKPLTTGFYIIKFSIFDDRKNQTTITKEITIK